MKTSKYFKDATLVMSYSSDLVIVFYNTIKIYIDEGLLNKRRVKKYIKKHNTKLMDYRGRIYPKEALL